jgi:Ser/Thr protein kinase RdoA (MazF antagonist)
VSDAVRERALAATRPGATTASVEPLRRGNRKRTEVVRFDAAAPVVVQYSETPEAIRTEAALLAAVDARTDVPVPRPLGDGVVDGTGWLVTPLVEGRDLHEAFVELDPAARRGVARAFGRFLATLHETFRFPGCGPLTTDGAPANGSGADEAPNDEPTTAESVRGRDRDPSLSVSDPTGAAEWVRRFGERHAARLPADFDDLRERIRDALRGPIEADAEPRLFPWDFRPGNALVADGAVTAVLDWEAPLAAPRSVSVAKAEHLVVDWYVPASETGPLRRAFREGYESVAPLPTVERAHRAAAVASAVVDSGGTVTNPQYPPVDRDAAVEFHRAALRRALDGTGG